MSVEELEGGLRWLFGQLYNEAEFLRRKRQYMEIVKARASSAPGHVRVAQRDSPHLASANGCSV
jgi:hypothetical protein